MIIIENPDACTGCLICELACSFHHTRKYSRSHSSVRVDKSILNPEQNAKITIYVAKQGVHVPCNSCKEEEFPFCVQLCPEEVFTLKGSK